MGVVITMKGIKPAKLQVDKFRLAILNELRAEGSDQVKQLQKTTATWMGDKPTFESLIGLDSQGATVVTGPTGNTKGVQKWQWLDEGTPRHPIPKVPKPRGKSLRFRHGGFAPKTKPGVLTSGAGRSANGPWRFPRQVMHPGTKARGWAALLSKQRQVPFRERVFAALDRAAKAAF